MGRKLTLSGKRHTHTPLAREEAYQEIQRRTVVVLAFWGGRSLGEGISWLTCVAGWSVRTTLQRAPFLTDGRGMLVVYLENNEQI